MKLHTLLLSAAFVTVATASAVQADNSEIYQYGTNSTVQISQVSGLYNDNKAKLEQQKAALNESAFITQVGGNGRNDAQIYQNGAKDVANITQVEGRGKNQASIRQAYSSSVVSGNQASIVQVGWTGNNYAGIDQGFFEAKSLNNRARIQQASGAGDNYASILQGVLGFSGDVISSDNQATITQSDANILNNNASIVQGFSGNAVRDVASIEQSGVGGNFAFILQGFKGDSFDSFATIIQNGGNNRSKIDQWGSNKTATIIAAGNANTATVTQH